MKDLNIGDKIGIISTARKISLEELKPSIKLLEEWGLKVVFGKNLFEEDNQFSGTVSQRSSDLQSMIDDDSIKAILCARGGYGTVQIIDKVDFSHLIKNPKWIIGYSDVTVLHSHLHQLGITSLHATMPINFEKNTPKALESLKSALFGLGNLTEIDHHHFNRFGKVEGEIVGGNLSILYSLLGSDSDINTEGKILFIEDLDEYLYHVDRIMMNLKRNGKLKNLKALIIGGMSDMNDNTIPLGKTAEEIILEYIKEFDFPVCFNFPAGHLDDNRCIRLGVKSVLEVNKNGVSLSQ
jgi:muramoyltetrapeptide carboxypeptidase